MHCISVRGGALNLISLWTNGEIALSAKPTLTLAEWRGKGTGNLSSDARALSRRRGMLAMYLFCLKRAIRSVHACVARVGQCWAAAVQEPLRGLALAVPQLANELGRWR